MKDTGCTDGALSPWHTGRAPTERRGYSASFNGYPN
jgi:hypothetical protein